MSRRPSQKRSVLPDWLSGFSDDDGTEAPAIPTKFLRLLMCDAAGLRRCRVIPSYRVEQVIRQGVGMTSACMAMNVWSDTYPADCGLNGTGEIRLIPDIDNSVVCRWHPTHEMTVVDLHEAPGLPWSCCPRSALCRVLKSAEEKHKLVFRIGQEIEFYLLRPGVMDEITRSSLPEPVDGLNYSQTLAFDGVSTLMDDISECLESFGIPVEQLHAESGPGQFEIATGPAIGQQAADNVLYVREAVASIAQRHGLVATFIPKPFATASGSGAHTHLSFRTAGGEPLFTEFLPGLEKDGSTAESFVAGLLKHLPAVMLFTAPSPLSYMRFSPRTWSGAYRAWGINNREAPLRFCPGVDSKGANIEVKCVDNTCNPYIAFAAIITAGILGVEAKLRLPAAAEGDPADDDSAERLPHSVKDAIHSYEGDPEFREALEEAIGLPLLRAFVAVRKLELHTAEGKSQEEQILALYNRY